MLRSIRILTNYQVQPQWKIDILSRGGVFLEKRDVRFADLVKDKRFMEISNSQNLKLLEGPMLGHVSETGALVWAQLVLMQFLSFGIII